MGTLTSQMPNVWLPDIVFHIAQYLDDNEVACSLRLVDKVAAKLLPNRVIVRISRQAPFHAFSQHWTQPGAFHTLSFNKRRRFLVLVAASGCLRNLELAVQLAGCDLTASRDLPVKYDPLAAAAAAGHIHICGWLLERGCKLRFAHLESAARTGRQEMCTWLMDYDCPLCTKALEAALRGGHPELMPWLVARGRSAGHPEKPGRFILPSAAEGCDLATCQQLLYDGSWPLEGPEDEKWKMNYGVIALASAACSPTPDWRAKVEWLEALGCPRDSIVSRSAASCPYGVERLQWLLARGYPVNGLAVSDAAGYGHVAVVQFLLDLDAQLGVDSGSAELNAARAGHLSILQLMHERGWLKEHVEVLRNALKSGHLAVAAWMVDEAEVVTLEDLQTVAGSYTMFSKFNLGLELLEWLHARACRIPDDVLSWWMTSDDSEEVLEWLVANDYHFKDDGQPYRHAAHLGDLTTLACLHRLGCPWGRSMWTCATTLLPASVRAWADGLGLPYGISETESDGTGEDGEERGGRSVE